MPAAYLDTFQQCVEKCSLGYFGGIASYQVLNLGFGIPHRLSDWPTPVRYRLI
jgi:hypothetical protein